MLELMIAVTTLLGSITFFGASFVSNDDRSTFYRTSYALIGLAVVFSLMRIVELLKELIKLHPAG